MTVSTVIRDSSGNVINIGEWDYCYETVIDPETNVETKVIHNPLPAGAVISQEEIEVLPDGGLTVAS